MIEKCSIGKMNYSFQNISLMILILILIVVILFYIRNSESKHSELIEKYANTNIAEDSYDNNKTTDNNNGFFFPSNDSTITLRKCQVHFNNDNSSKYEYRDEWNEIDTIKTPNDVEERIVPFKIFGKDNTINVDDFNSSNVNYNEVSRCFKKINRDNTGDYKYSSNIFVQYNNSKFVYLNNDDSKKYMQLEFSYNPLVNNYNYHDKVLDSVCSLKYSNTLKGGFMGGLKLYRFALDSSDIITGINSITININNNHQFDVNSVTDLTELISQNSVGYRYNNTSNLFQYYSIEPNIEDRYTNIQIYRFKRELLCNNTNNILSYSRVNKILNTNNLLTIPTNNGVSISNTGPLKNPFNVNSTIFNRIKEGGDKKTLLSNIQELIDSNISAYNAPIQQEIERLTNQLNGNSANSLKSIYDKFYNNNNTKSKFITNASSQANYDKAIYNTLLNSNNFKIEIGKTVVNVVSYALSDSNVKVSDDIVLKLLKYTKNSKVLEEDVYETRIFTVDSSVKSITFHKDTYCDVLIVAGGGGGGMDIGGGGGGGGVIKLNNTKINRGTYNIVVGEGGTGAPPGCDKGQPCWHQFTINGRNGGNSSFNNNVAIGGGYGGTSYHHYTLRGQGNSGGSGGGSSGYHAAENINDSKTRAGKGTENQGFDGGYGIQQYYSGGGGGAGQKGKEHSSQIGDANGGIGKVSAIIDDIPFYWGGGGGGSGLATLGGNGGIGGGGSGAIGTPKGGAGFFTGSSGGQGSVWSWAQVPGGDGAPYTGGGGGGGSHFHRYNRGGDGGSGIVVIKYYKYGLPVSDDKEKNYLTLDYNFNYNTYPKLNNRALYAWYKFDGNSNDSSGNNRHMWHWRNSRLRYGFNNILKKGYADFSTGFLYTDKINLSARRYTMTYWVRVNNIHGCWITQGHQHGGNMYLHIGCRYGNSYCLAFYANDLESPGVWSSRPYTNEHTQWVFMSYVVKANHNRIIYRNGKVISSDKNTSPFRGSNNFYIHQHHEYISDLRIYEDDLTKDEIKELYNGYFKQVDYKLKNTKDKIIRIENQGVQHVINTEELKLYLNITATYNNSGEASPLAYYSFNLKSDNPKITDISRQGIGLHEEFLNYSVKYNIYETLTTINNKSITFPNNNKNLKIYNYNDASSGIIINDENKDKYNKYKISTYIQKSYKNALSSSGISFNVNLRFKSSTETRDLILNTQYSIKYTFPKENVSETDELIPIDIIFTIIPLMRTGKIDIYTQYNNNNIYTFLHGDGIADFNSIKDADWNTSLIAKNDNWGMKEKITEISNIQATKINNNNINSKCNAQNATICDIKALKDIKNRISNFVPQNSNGPTLNNDTIITNVVMDNNTVYTSDITELISYESPTDKTPTNKNVAAFNILNTSKKYIYFMKSS
jgi:hypothetical protein